MVLKNSYTYYLLKLGGIEKKMRPNSTFNKHSLSTISSFCYSHLIELHIHSTFSNRFRVHIFSRGVPPDFPSPDPISDQNMAQSQFQTHKKIHPF